MKLEKFQYAGFGPPIVESSLTYVIIPSAAANTGVFSGTIKSIAFLSFPI